MKKGVRRRKIGDIADKVRVKSQTKIKKVLNKRTLKIQCPFKVDFAGFIFECCNSIIM